MQDFCICDCSCRLLILSSFNTHNSHAAYLYSDFCNAAPLCSVSMHMRDAYAAYLYSDSMLKQLTCTFAYAQCSCTPVVLNTLAYVQYVASLYSNSCICAMLKQLTCIQYFCICTTSMQLTCTQYFCSYTMLMQLTCTQILANAIGMQPTCTQYPCICAMPMQLTCTQTLVYAQCPCS